MAKFSLDAAEDLTPTSNRCTEKGKYHFAVSSIMTETKRGESIDGFACELDVLAGSVAGQEGKSMMIYFNNPKGDNEDGRRIAQQLQTAFFIAVNLLDPSSLGKAVEFELEDAVGRQFVMEVERRQEKDDKGGWTKLSDKHMRACYSNCYHVDDPQVTDVPKSKDALDCIDKAHRRPAEFFGFNAPAKKTEKPKQAWKDVDL